MAVMIREDSLMVANNRRPAAKPDLIDEPLQFNSFLRTQVWGGHALAEFYGKRPPASPLAFQGTEVPIGESWEVCGLPEQPSIVLTGAYAGQTLTDLWNTRSQDLLGKPNPSPVFPLFVKWLDCQDYLSVQVHPNDAVAQQVLGQTCGKSEAWVVVHAEPTAKIYAGLRPGVTAEELLDRVARGTVEECLHSFQPKTGDCISLPAGTIHSAGGGVVFAEVQQPSDLTFRLFDWNRVGLDGKPRPLHLEMAMQSITWPQQPVSPMKPVPIPGQDETQGEVLLKTPQFELERYTVGNSWPQPHSGEMTIWMVLEGEAVLDGAGYSPHLFLERGSTVMIPAGTKNSEWASADALASCQLLCVRLPAA